MTLDNRCFRQLRLAVCLALLVFSAVTANAQTPIFNVADFGAVGDGVADDGPAFQKALNAVADAGGGTLLVPAGLYFIATPVVKDFSSLNGAEVSIQGVPSLTMTAPPTANGDQLAASLDLASEIIPATGAVDCAFTLTNLRKLSIEHLAFTGRETEYTDAFITLNLSDINEATVRHCEFYGISTFGLMPGHGGGNLVRAVRSDLSIEQTVFLGATANSGAYAPIVENIEWYGFHISNSIFIDYGVRSFFGKMGLGAPLSWINFGNVAPRTPESPRREIVIRDTFLDEGGWIGITAFGHRWGAPVDPIDLLYISGLKMNVSNLGTAGHQLFDVSNVLIENSHYGWSHNTGAAIDIYRSGHAILDRLTCIEDADRIRVDAATARLTVVNSEFGGLDSLAQTTTVLETAPNEDPVQYVRQQFVSLLGKEPDPAAHFYWSDLLVRCDGDQNCLEAQRAELKEFLDSKPQRDFSFSGTVTDDDGNPLSGATVNLTGSQSTSALTNEQGKFEFFGLPTSGLYTVTVNKRHYTFTKNSETFERPSHDVDVVLRGELNHHSIGGRIVKRDGTGVSGVTVQLIQLGTTTKTDADGNFSFPNLPAGQNYTIVPVAINPMVIAPANALFVDLGENRTANFIGKLRPQVATIDQQSENALVFDSVSFVSQSISLFDPLFSNDGRTRLIIFARNLEHVNSTSQLSMTAQDDNNNVYPVPVEFVGNVQAVSGLKQINVRMWPTLGSGKCLRLRLYSDSLESNITRFCFASVKSGS